MGLPGDQLRANRATEAPTSATIFAVRPPRERPSCLMISAAPGASWEPPCGMRTSARWRGKDRDTSANGMNRPLGWFCWMTGERMEWMAPARNGRALRHSADVIICQERSPIMQVTTVGLDLGKGCLSSPRHCRRRHGRLQSFDPAQAGSQVLREALASCLVGIEACGSAHHWARELRDLGHAVRLMPAVYVKPYVKRGKTDAVDAEAICEAVTRPTMRFVAVKSKEQQALLSMHRVRELIVRQKTQVSERDPWASPRVRPRDRERACRRNALCQSLPDWRLSRHPRSGEERAQHALRPGDLARRSGGLL